MELTKETIRNQFYSWVKTLSDKDPGTLNEIVLACLDDAIERMLMEFGKQPPDPSREHETMKQLLDYWSSNVYMIIERGVASDIFRGTKMPGTNEGKAKLLHDYHQLRNECYAGYFH